MPSYTRLKGVTDVNQSTLCDALESNIITFFNWGMLCIGAFGNVNLGMQSPYGQADMSRLRPVSDRNFTNGQVWEGFRQDWVWESGIEYPVQPIHVSGVYVNSAFYPLNTTGTYSYYINYPLGRVVFNNPLPLSSVVQASYSYRMFTFQSADANWFRQIMFESFRVDNSDFLQYGSGVWNVLAQDRVQLPAVVIEVVPRRTISGFELGGTSNIKQDVLFHIFSETPWDRKNMMDYISYQIDKTLPMFDKNLLIQQDAFPLDQNGSIAPNAKCFPDLVLPTGQGGFYWTYCTFLQTSIQETISVPPLYQALAKTTLELNLLLV